MTVYNFKVKHFVDKVKPHIMIDRAFQRKVCWSAKTRREFILSANRGRAFYPIVVADVKSGLTHSEEHSKEYSCMKYEEAVNLRKDYISLDGQNRAQAWDDFFDDKVHLTGTFIDADGREVDVINSTYSHLPERLQDALRDTEIQLAVAEGCYYDELHDIFININSGEALNAQEIRNATQSFISEYVRKEAGKNHVQNMLSNVSGFDESKIQRSFDAEYVIKAYMATLTNDKGDNMDYNLGKKELDKFYADGKGKLQKNVPQYSLYNTRRFSNILTLQSKILESQSKVTQKILWLSLYVAERVLYEDQKTINDYSELYNIITTLDSKLCDDSRTDLGKDLDTWKKNGEDPDDKPSSSNYYHQWSSDPKCSASRYKRKEEFFDALYTREDFLALLEISKIAV